MSLRSLACCLVAAMLACTTTPDDGAESGSGTSAGSNPTSDDTTGPGTGSSTTATAGATTGAVDPTTGGPTSDGTTTGTSATPTTGTTEAADSSSGPGTAETGPAAVGFTEVYEQVILPNGCNAGYCHGGGAGGLTMTDEATTYANLVDVAATSAMCDQTMRVVPGAIESSILWYRVRPAALDGGIPCAPKMPQGSMGLNDSEAKLVDDWIAGGALE